MEPQLHALVLGATLVHLRERRGLKQNELAEQVGLSKNKMSRIEMGRSLVDTNLLQRLCAALGIERSRLLELVDEGMTRTREAARQTLRASSKDWWDVVQSRVGALGTAALVTFSVSDVLVQQSA